jgi:hypothetical protein
MTAISIRDLQKLSSKSIAALAGPTPVKAGDRTVAILTPIKAPASERLEAVLRELKEAAKQRDPVEDEAAMRAAGVDPAEWPDEDLDAPRAEPSTRKRGRG